MMIKTFAKAIVVQQRRFNAEKCGTAKAVRRYVMRREDGNIPDYLRAMSTMDIRWDKQKNIEEG